MSEINHFKKIILCSGDVAADLNHLHVKRIHLESLVCHLYIVREYYCITLLMLLINLMILALCML
jgi:hypothetical protein